VEGEVTMTDYEMEIIKLIRENDNQEEAVVTAVNVILSFLELRESSQQPSACSLQVQA
jgi:hypothetical protein